MAKTALAVSTVPERVSVLETKVDNIEEKIDDLKMDLKAVSESIDQQAAHTIAILKDMKDVSTTAHIDMANKISNLEKFKEKWIYLIAGGIAVLGWVGPHAEQLLSLLK